ncbi:dihydrolipoamide acetyltransferase family protein [Marinobacterium stanieri]|uniref:Pyruvate dehydrogenase E2 component (Dihydrolipoamide acetyltransferase) n=1 Tax=Marinobacterium stanieri TaxID=49186 RepID=A0A1N6NZ91_9GAMM|nr:dihydrolipoamide acetyltransferase family protein [Marinobacterium stanieri]SIP97399.1 pyruvate dehydrogenase E2 component (dihydrolipoamide acetyltransferase) [Marinobacterium stanieri]
MNMMTEDKHTGVTTLPMRGMRGMIADNMRRSLDEAAQLTHHADCDVTELLATKARLASQDIKVSVEDLIAQAVITTLESHPALNGRVEDKEIHLYDQAHLSLAMALPDNLLVAPAIFNAGEMSLLERSTARKELAQRARSGKLSVNEMTGGTFTLSNLGLSRVRHFTPIINRPQIAILGIGETGLRPWVMPDGSIQARKIMGLSLTFDHRAVDGAPAANFLSALCTLIEQG